MDINVAEVTSSRLAEHGVTIELTDDARDWLAREFAEGDHIVADITDDRLGLEFTKSRVQELALATV